MKHEEVQTNFIVEFNFKYYLIFWECLPDCILIDMQFSIFKVSQYSLEWTAVEFRVEPVIVKQNFCVQVREAFRPDQMERELTKLEIY